MPTSIPRPIYGLEPIIAVTALAVATVDAVVVPAALLLSIDPAHVLSKVAIASAIVTALVFIRLLVSPVQPVSAQDPVTRAEASYRREIVTMLEQILFKLTSKTATVIYAKQYDIEGTKASSAAPRDSARRLRCSHSAPRPANWLGAPARLNGAALVAMAPASRR